MAKLIRGKNPNKPYTVRYYYDGRQREKSFRTYREATDFQARFEYESREQTFVDPRVGGQKFKDAAEAWLARHPGRSYRTYERALRLHVNPVFGGRSLSSVARDREGVANFLLIDLPGKGNQGPSQQRTCYTVLGGVINEAVRMGKLTGHRLGSIRIPEPVRKAEFEFPSYAQLTALAKSLGDDGLAIWLMRGCGLRPGEALAVHSDGLRGHTLRVTEQLRNDGTYGPLKHRKPGDFRDIPLPAYVGAMAKDRVPAGGGYLMAGASRKAFTHKFARTRGSAGLEEFTPHMLRHVFASVALAHGVPITDVSTWLGHRNINVTYATYKHLIPSAVDRARKVLDDEYQSWRGDDG